MNNSKFQTPTLEKIQSLMYNCRKHCVFIRTCSEIPSLIPSVRSFVLSEENQGKNELNELEDLITIAINEQL